jgi:hypothetical protein
MIASPSRRLEHYTEQRPSEVLLVNIRSQGQPDQIAIFKGFSSSLMCPTAFDADLPVLPDDAEIQSIDRLHSPYNPNDPRYIQQGLTWTDFECLLAEVGL